MQVGCLIEVKTRRGYDAHSYILWAESKKNNYILIDIKYAALTKSCKKYVVPHMYDVPLYLLPSEPGQLVVAGTVGLAWVREQSTAVMAPSKVTGETCIGSKGYQSVLA